VRVIRVMYVAAAVFAVVGLWFRMAPLPAPAMPHASVVVPQIAPRVGAPGGDAPAATYAPIVTANIFSRARTAPERLAAGGQSTPRARPAPAAPTFTLLGTTIGPQGAVALIDASAASPAGAQVHRMGDVVAGARLVAITDSTVTLDRPSGPLVLHLQSSQHKKL
jgi:hypothetical protein